MMYTSLFYYALLFTVVIAGTDIDGKKRFTNEANRRLGWFSSSPVVVSKEQQGKMQFWKQREGKDIEYVDKAELTNALDARGTSVEAINKEFATKIDDSDSIDSSDADVIRGILKNKPIKTSMQNAEIYSNSSRSVTQTNQTNSSTTLNSDSNSTTTTATPVTSTFNSLNSESSESTGNGNNVKTADAVMQPNGEIYYTHLPTETTETTKDTTKDSIKDTETSTQTTETKKDVQQTEKVNTVDEQSNIEIIPLSNGGTNGATNGETNSAIYPQTGDLSRFRLETPTPENTNSDKANSLESDSQRINEKETVESTASVTASVVDGAVEKSYDSDANTNNAINADKSNVQTTEKRKAVLKCVEVYED